jgi:hypothetical protein
MIMGLVALVALGAVGLLIALKTAPTERAAAAQLDVVRSVRASVPAIALPSALTASRSGAAPPALVAKDSSASKRKVAPKPQAKLTKKAGKTAPKPKGAARSPGTGSRAAR